MPKVEIDEAELAQLRGVNAFVDTGLKNPKTRNALLKVQKELNPNAVIPEIDAAEPIRAEVDGIRKEMSDFFKKLDERDAKRAEAEREAALTGRIAAGRKILTDRGYNAEGVEKIEALMTARQLADYEAGLLVFEAANPPSRPADASVSRWGSFSDQQDPFKADDWFNKALIESQGKDDSALNKQVAQIFSDIRH